MGVAVGGTGVLGPVAGVCGCQRGGGWHDNHGGATIAPPGIGLATPIGVPGLPGFVGPPTVSAGFCVNSPLGQL